MAGQSWRDAWNGATATIGDRREALMLVEEVSGYEGADLLLMLEKEAPVRLANRLNALALRRREGEPLQHLIGHWAFRRLDLAVSEAALIPRPETEQVVEIALRELRRIEGYRVADLGTGTGAIALSVALEEPSTEIYATDSSPAALRLASANLAGHGRAGGSRVRLLEGHWYEALPASLAGTFDLIVSNPPYVSQAEWELLDPVVRLHDPRQALVAGPSGLEAIEEVVSGARKWLSRPACLVVEIAPHQAEAARRFAEEAGLTEVLVERDLVGRDRMVVGRIG